MLNSVVLVGRLVEDPSYSESEGGTKYLRFNLAVSKPFPNKEGEYEVDFVKCVTFDALAQSTSDICKKGSIIGLRGRLSTSISVLTIGNESKKIENMHVIAERISFIKI